MKEKSFIILSQLGSNYKNDNHSHCLLLPLTSSQNPKLVRQKPQIAIVPGISPKEQNRYRVVLKEEILGDRLTIDQAIALANQSTHH